MSASSSYFTMSPVSLRRALTFALLLDLWQQPTASFSTISSNSNNNNNNHGPHHILLRGPSYSSRLHTTVWATETPRGSDDCSSSVRNTQNSTDSSGNALRNTLRRLAQLSLEDYEWRSSVFDATQADRMVETSLARMRGQDPDYVRPMDATLPGPLGRLELSAVTWLRNVIEEEGRRAQAIVQNDGDLVRPMDTTSSSSSSSFQELGPLGRIEKAVVDFIHRIKYSETERVKAGVLRPKDVDKATRGVLGDLEQEAVRILEEINESERLRAEQSKQRGGALVRPIDVPGPLGDLEKQVSELFRAEQLRSQQKELSGGKVVRPKDAKVRGPLGEAEFQTYQTIKELNAEEMQRLRSIQKVLRENRPMEADRTSPLGVLESVIVGVLSAPKLIVSVIGRVQELLSSEELPVPTDTTLESPENNDSKPKRKDKES